jgi:hypothetical protein
MIIHKAISPILEAFSLTVFPKEVDVKAFIVFAEKYILSTIPFLDDMMGKIGNHNSGDSGHLCFGGYIQRRSARRPILSKVYKVFDKEISAKVALKLLKPEIVTDKNTEMLTGRVPFEGDTPFAIGMKHKGDPRIRRMSTHKFPRL